MRSPTRQWTSNQRRKGPPDKQVSFVEEVQVIGVARTIAGKTRVKPKERPRFSGRIVFKVHQTTVKEISETMDGEEDFIGACLDIGAQRSVIGEKQAKAYCRAAGRKYNLSRSHYSFMFGGGLYASLGSMEMRIPTPDGAFLALSVDVVRAKVPMLLGIDVLDRERLLADNVENVVLHSRLYGWKMPVVSRGAGRGLGGHMYLVWDTALTMYTQSELKKMHLHFYHPSARKLYNLLKRASPDSVDGSTLKTLEDVSKACRTCTVYSSGPHRFRVSVPKTSIVFNHELSLDLMYPEHRRAALHVIDVG